LIGERFFTLFDANRDGYAGHDEFVAGACRILSADIDKCMRMVFDMYDFDNDGIISQEDIRLLLSWVPITQIVAEKKQDDRTQGMYTKNGGGL
jgi:Ca2+-binding EF-hand superfamily protein